MTVFRSEYFRIKFNSFLTFGSFLWLCIITIYWHLLLFKGYTPFKLISCYWRFILQYTFFCICFWIFSLWYWRFIILILCSLCSWIITQTSSKFISSIILCFSVCLKLWFLKFLFFMCNCFFLYLMCLLKRRIRMHLLL